MIGKLSKQLVDCCRRRLGRRVAAVCVASGIAVSTIVADEPKPIRPVFSAYTVEIGSSSMADSYLTPITYRGWSLALGYERWQAMRFDPERWVMELALRLDFDRGRNHADNATTWRVDFDARWAMMRRFRVADGFSFGVGGATGIDVGCLYNARNSNNPASAKAAWTVDFTGFASWSSKLWGVPFTLRYQPALPLAGIFFSPQYDELYYEIYLGNHDHLVHFANPFDRFAMTNLLTADLRFGATSLRLGYRSTILSSEVNHLVTNVFTHAFVIGLSGEWISLTPSRRELSADARVISAVY